MNSPGKIHGDQQCAHIEESMRLPTVAGRMEMTHEAFQRACQVQLMHLQESLLPDNALVHTLCEAIRCSRECCEIAGGSESKHKIDTQSTRIRELEAKVESLNGHEVMREYDRLFKAHPFYYKAEHTPLVNDCVALAWTAVRNILERATTTQKG